MTGLEGGQPSGDLASQLASELQELMGGLPVGARFVVDELLAVIANSGNERYFWPSPTVILMLPHRPVYDGFPVSVPVVVEKLAQYGLFVT